MKEYTVTIPIAGHVIITVEAENEAEATERAFAEVTNDHIESWETLTRFTQGNVCYCPQPWEVEVVEECDAE